MLSPLLLQVALGSAAQQSYSQGTQGQFSSEPPLSGSDPMVAFGELKSELDNSFSLQTLHSLMIFPSAPLFLLCN